MTELDLDEGSNRRNCSYCKSARQVRARCEIEALGGTFHAIHVPTLDLAPEQFAAIHVRDINGRERRYDEAPAYPHAL